MTIFDIEVVSDVVCPACFTGKRRLERAIYLYKKTYPGGRSDDFNVKWTAHYLRPDAPVEPIDKVTHLANRMGEHRVVPTVQRMQQLGEAEGIHFNFEGRLGNTRDAHRLIYLVGEKRGLLAQDVLVDRLFQAFHELGKDISAHEVLRSVAIETGVSAMEVDEWLNSDLGGPEADEEAAEAAKKRSIGVPRFILQGHYELEGAQDPTDFIQVFAKIKEGHMSDREVEITNMAEAAATCK